jgi:nucleotide-binding universal stress UspA family protein
VPDTAGSPPPLLIAYDGSDHAKAAVASAARLFPGRAAEVVTAWRSVKEVVPASLVALPASVAHEAQVKMDEAERNEAQGLADAGAGLARDAGLDARGQAIEAAGAIWPAIIRAAEDAGAEAVIVGSRGRSPIRSAILGSVSAGVVNHSKRPVVVVRAAEPSQPPA